MVVNHSRQSSAGVAGQVVVELDFVAINCGIDQSLALGLSCLHVYLCLYDAVRISNATKEILPKTQKGGVRLGVGNVVTIRMKLMPGCGAE
jgi:hypothetical protein